MMGKKLRATMRLLLLASLALLTLSPASWADRWFWGEKGTPDCPEIGFCHWWNCESGSDCDRFSNPGPGGEPAAWLCGPSEGNADHKKCLTNDPSIGWRAVACIHDPSDGNFRCLYKVPPGSRSYCRDSGDCCTAGADCNGQGSPYATCVNHKCIISTPAAPTIQSLQLQYKAGPPEEYWCVIKASDPNPGDTLVATYDWYADGNAQPPLHRTKLVGNGVDTLLDKLSVSAMATGSWYCSAKVSDGSTSTAWVNSNPISICKALGNACTKQADCCPGTTGMVCSAQNNVCIMCKAFGTGCAGTRDCCPGQGLACGTGGSNLNKCCKDAGMACSAASECCSGKCGTDGKCSTNHPPAKPPAPRIVASSANPAVPAICQAVFPLESNCPPVPVTTDPDPGDTVSMMYQWHVEGTAMGWSSQPTFQASCMGPPLAYPCASGSRITLKSRACDQMMVCTESDLSNAVSWPGTPVPGPPTHQPDMAYLLFPLLAAFFILALAYMLSKIFSLQHWLPIISDEMVQLLATGLVALILLGLQAALDTTLADALVAGGGTAAPGGIYAAAQNNLNTLGNEVGGFLTELSTRSMDIGREASKGIYCNMLGTGFTLVNCSPLNAFRGSMTTAAFSVMVGSIDINAQKFILALANNYAFTLLIPLGLFFRCFKLSRPAGGALIAIGIGFYSIYPLVIVLVNTSLGNLNSPFGQPSRMGVPELRHGAPNDNECDPYQLDPVESKRQFTDFLLEISSRDRVVGLAYLVLVKTIMLSVINILITLGFIAAFAKILGSDIDLSGLARIG